MIAERVKTFRALFLETSQPKYVKIVHLLLIKRYFVSFVIFGTNTISNILMRNARWGLWCRSNSYMKKKKTSQFRILTENIRKGVKFPKL